MKQTRHYENGDITTIIEYVFAGYGLNAQGVYGKRVTTYSIADGVIRDGEYIAPAVWYR